MKTKQLKELFDKDTKELRSMLREIKNKLLHLKLDNERKKLKNTSSISHMRKDMARIYTALYKGENNK